MRPKMTPETTTYLLCIQCSSLYCDAQRSGSAAAPCAVRGNRLLADRCCRPVKPSKTFMPRSGEVEAVQVHHLGPRRHEVLDEHLLRIRARVDLGEGPQLRVRAEHEVDARAGPLDLPRPAVAPLEQVLRVRDRLPLR